MRKTTLYIALLTLVLSACTSPRREAMRQRLQYVADCNRADTLFSARWLPTVDSLVSYFDPSSRSWTERIFSLPFREGAGVGSNERMMAHYLQGRVHHDMGEAPQALECYQKAAEQADTTSNDCDYRQLSRVYAQTASIFLRQNLPAYAISNLSQAGHYALLACDTFTYVNSLEHIAEAYYELQDFAKTVSLSRDAFTKYLALGEENAAYTALQLTIFAALEEENFNLADSCLKVYENRSAFVDSSFAVTPGHDIYYYLKASILSHSGDVYNAITFFKRILTSTNALNMKVFAFRGLTSSYQYAHQKDSMAKYAVLYSQYNDSSTNALRTQELQQLQVLYDYNRQSQIAEQMKTRSIRSELVLYIILLTSLLLLTIIAALAFRYWTKIREKIAKANFEYLRLLMQYLYEQMKLQIARDQNDENTDALRECQEKVDEARIQLAKFREESQSLWDVKYQMLDHPIVKKFHTFARLNERPSDSDWHELRRFVNDQLPGFVQTLGLLADLDNKETAICILVKLRFIPSEISNLLSVRSQSLSNTRSRLNQKLFKKSGGAKDFDESIITLTPKI